MTRKFKHSYQKYLSDIPGQDTEAHRGNIKNVSKIIRDWLSMFTIKTLPSGSIIYKKFLSFKNDLPKMCKYHEMTMREMTYKDFLLLIRAWIKKEEKER